MLSIVLVYFALLVSLKCNWSNDVCRYMYSMMSHVLCTVTEWSVIETLLSNVIIHRLLEEGFIEQAEQEKHRIEQVRIVSSLLRNFYFLPLPTTCMSPPFPPAVP